MTPMLLGVVLGASIFGNLVAFVWVNITNSYRSMDSRASASNTLKMLEWLQHLEQERRPSAEIEPFFKNGRTWARTHDDHWTISYDEDDSGRIAKVFVDRQSVAGKIEFMKRSK